MYQQAIELLKCLISIPSLSREEDQTAGAIESFLEKQGCKTFRKKNNVWTCSMIDDRLPVILLNSHHDTVKPVSSWTRDPFVPTMEEGKLYGLGSNDAGAALVSLLTVFLILKDRTDRKYNLIFAATAEEEISGKDGIVHILDDLGPVHLAVVGEPTHMQMAVAEKGLMVLDCEATGKTGHAAREEGINAIYRAIDDIEWFRNYRFPHSSSFLGEVKMTATVIQAGYQHNVIPDSCKYVVDVRTNEFYKNTEALDIIHQHLKYSSAHPRSTYLNSSSIPLDHPVVKKGLSLGLNAFGSPTTSDQARIPYTSVKIGPGDSTRSHTADEFIFLNEIEQGIDLYVSLLDDLALSL